MTLMYDNGPVAPRDLLIRGARIVELGPSAGPVIPEAAEPPRPAGEPVDLRIRGGVVIALAPTLPDRGADVLDADGRWLLPGLWDHHVHLAQWARTLDRLDLAGCHGPADVVARVRSALAESTAPVLTGFGYRSATWSHPPTVAELDAVSGDRPVVLISGDAHNGWLNSAALALLGVPPRVGPLDENDWFPVFARLDRLPRDEAADEAAYREALRRASARGIVGVTDMEFGRGFEDWPSRAGRGIGGLRVRVATYPETLEEVIALGLRSGTPLLPGDDLLTMGPLKVISDGSLNTRTAYCTEPYVDDPASRGTLNVAPDELERLLTRATEHGLTAAVHAIGDAAVGHAVDAFAATGARGSIEHAQLLTPADITRMAGLPVTASVQPAHLLDDRDVTQLCWPDRADRCFPLRSLHEGGVVLAFGSDAPVAPLDPWLAMAAAVHRSADERPAWNPAEALTPAQALAASTDGAGTVAVASPADLVLVDDDPLAPCNDNVVAAQRLRQAHVTLTMVGGRITHDAL